MRHLLTTLPLCCICSAVCQHKALFLKVLWSQSAKSRVWKNVWLEWSKVCQGDENMDSILAFQMQEDGKMRGSEMQNRAFASL